MLCLFPCFNVADGTRNGFWYEICWRSGFRFRIELSEGIHLESVASIQHAQAKAHLVLFVPNDKKNKPQRELLILNLPHIIRMSRMPYCAGISCLRVWLHAMKDHEVTKSATHELLIYSAYKPH